MKNVFKVENSILVTHCVNCHFEGNLLFEHIVKLELTDSPPKPLHAQTRIDTSVVTTNTFSCHWWRNPP